MNQLPAVLQKEIWDYVGGDQKHWRNCFRQVTLEFKARVWREEHWEYDYDSSDYPIHLRILGTLTDRNFNMIYNPCEGVPVINGIEQVLGCGKFECMGKIRCYHEINHRKNLPPKDQWITNFIQLFNYNSKWKDNFASSLTEKEAALLVKFAPSFTPLFNAHFGCKDPATKEMNATFLI